MSSKTQFEEVVLNNYHWFMRYVISIIKDQHAAEDIVQEVYLFVPIKTMTLMKKMESLGDG